MKKPSKAKEPVLSYFDVLLEWNSGSEDSYKCPEEFKAKFKKATISEEEKEYNKRKEQ